MLAARITVAIPCYNGARYVGPAIESVLAQSHPADQVIVVDDGSSDTSVDIVRRYPVTLIQHEVNRGLASARNSAIEAAAGDVIAFLDVDALADPQWAATLLSGYSSDDIGGVGGQGIEANVRSLADRWRSLHATQGHGRVAKDVDFLYGMCMSFRKKVLCQVGGFSDRFRTNAEDIDVGLRINSAGYRLRYLPRAQVFHQRSDDVTSLKRTMVAWYAGAYRAKRANRAGAWRLFAGTLRRLAADPLADLIFERDWQLARLSWQMGWIKLNALWQEARNT